MNEITVQTLKAAIDGNEDFQLIDVREVYEHKSGNIGGKLIPMSEIPQCTERISREKRVIVYCRSGARSGNVVAWLERNHGFTNLYNLKGGILAWRREIDPSLIVF